MFYSFHILSLACTAHAGYERKIPYSDLLCDCLQGEIGILILILLERPLYISLRNRFLAQHLDNFSSVSHHKLVLFLCDRFPNLTLAAGEIFPSV